MSLLFFKALRNSVKSGVTIKETSINKDVSNKMNLRERKKKRIANNAMTNAVEVVIEEVEATSEDLHLPPEVKEVVVEENIDLAHQTVTAKEISEEMMITAHLEIAMEVVAAVHQAIVAEMIDADTDK